MAHVPTELQSGMGARSYETFSVGCAPGVKGGILLYVPQTKRIIVRRTFKAIGPRRPQTLTTPYDIEYDTEPINSDLSSTLDSDNDDVPDSTPVNSGIVLPNLSVTPPASSDNFSTNISVDSLVSNDVINASGRLVDSPNIASTSVEPCASVVLPSDDTTILPTITSTRRIIAKTTSSRKNRKATVNHSNGRVNRVNTSTSITQSENPYKKVYSNTRRTALASELCSTLSSSDSSTGDDSDLSSYCSDDLLLNQRIACAISKSMTTPTGVPRSVKQALSSTESAEWTTAIRAELSSMVDTNTLLPLSIPIEDIGNYNKLYTQLVFDKRYNPDGTFKKYRVRLVGRGDLQTWDTYQETYAGTATATSINIVLAIAAELDLELEALDIKSAFLYPKYTGPKLIVKRPPGLTDDDMPEYMELGKCIYGLRQAAHEFRSHLNNTLTQIGFVPTRADPCVYVYREGKEFVIACTHVDDIGLAGTSLES
jgi:hypothetical protein